MVPWEPMGISILNASNNLVDLKSDKVVCSQAGILSATVTRHTYVRSSFAYGPRTHNKTPRLTFPPPGDLSQTRSNDRPSRVSELRSLHNASNSRMLQLHSIPADAAAPCSRRNASKLQTRSLILYSALRALRGMKRSTTFKKNVSYA